MTHTSSGPPVTNIMKYMSLSWIILACSRLRDTWDRWIVWIDRERQRKYNGWKLGKEGAVEPVIISLNDPFRYTSSWLVRLVRFHRLYQHSQSGSFLSLREMACAVHAREIEESTISSCVERMFTRFPAHRIAEEGTEDLPCELGTWTRCFCNLTDWLRSCLITKWQ